jgi:hypothetical protein
MTHIFAHRRSRLSFAVLTIALSTLTACSYGPPAAQPVVTAGGCPKVAIIRDLSIYQHPPAADESNLVISARMGNVQNNCKTDEDGNGVSDPLAQTSFDVVSLRGANTAGKRAAMPFSVSVVDEHEHVIKKEVYEIPVLFHDDRREMTLTIPVNPDVGLPTDQDPSKYQVLIGFQLSAEQLKANTAFFSQIAEPTPAGPVTVEPIPAEPAHVDSTPDYPARKE